VVADGSDLILESGTGDRVVVSGPGLIKADADGTLALDSGLLQADLVPGGARRFRAGQFAIEVVGTVFSLGRQDAAAWLTVDQGAVACREPGAAAQTIVRAGGGWVGGQGYFHLRPIALPADAHDPDWLGSTDPRAPELAADVRGSAANAVVLSFTGAAPWAEPWRQRILTVPLDGRQAIGLGLWHRGGSWDLELVEGTAGRPSRLNLGQERFLVRLPASERWTWTAFPWSVFTRRSQQEPEPQTDGLTCERIVAIGFIAQGNGADGRLSVQGLGLLDRQPAQP
jgi:hypothetical protein